MGRVTLLVSIIVITLAGCPGDVLRDLANPGEFAMYGLSDDMSPVTIRFSQGATVLIGSAGGAGDKEFTIKNLSEQGVLRLTGSPRIKFYGGIASQMSVEAQPPGAIDPEDTTTFTVSFSGGAAGQTCEMVIETNDPEVEEFGIVLKSN